MLPAGLRRVVTSIAWLSVEQIIRAVVGVLVGIYVARHLGPRSFGILSFATSFVLLFSALAQLGLRNVVVRDLVARPEQEASVLGAALALRIAGSVLAVTIAIVAAWLTQEDWTTRLVILIIVAGILFDPFDVAAYWFEAHVFARPLVIAKMVGFLVAAGLRLVFIFAGKSVVWFAWPPLLESLLSIVILWISFYHHRSRTGNVSWRWRPSGARMRNLIGQAWPLALSGAAVQIHQRLDQVMLGTILRPEEVGWYAAASRISQVLYVMPVIFSTTLLPAIIRSKETSQVSYARRMQALFDLLLWCSLIVAVIVTLTSEYFVRIAYGEAYLPTGPILQIHAWSLVFISMGIARRQYLVAEELYIYALVNALAGVATNIALNLLLIPRYGGVGAAWALLVSTAISGFLINLGFRDTRAAGVMAMTALAAPLRLLAWCWRESRRDRR